MAEQFSLTPRPDLWRMDRMNASPPRAAAIARAAPADRPTQARFLKCPFSLGEAGAARCLRLFRKRRDARVRVLTPGSPRRVRSKHPSADSAQAPVPAGEGITSTPTGVEVRLRMSKAAARAKFRSVKAEDYPGACAKIDHSKPSRGGARHGLRAGALPAKVDRVTPRCERGQS